MGHRPLQRKANVNTQIDENRARIEQVERRQLAGRWWEPDCEVTNPDDDGCTGLEPPLENGFAQPTPGSGPNGGDLERFAFRLHTDGSLEFKGHLDVSGASSGDIAFVVPGAVDGEIDFRPANDQFFGPLVFEDGSLGMAYVDSVFGEVVIEWPVS